MYYQIQESLHPVKSTHIHYEVPVETGSVFRKGFRQEVGMLVFRLRMRDLNLSLLDMFSQEVVTDVYVLRVRVRHRVDR